MALARFLQERKLVLTHVDQIAGDFFGDQRGGAARVTGSFAINFQPFAVGVVRAVAAIRVAGAVGIVDRVR